MSGSAEAYVGATRRLRPATVASDYYRGLFDTCAAPAAAFGVAPRFHVTYSSERTCETVRIGDETWIIYDQYLGQTFNQLNRLWLNSTDPEEVVAYAFKVMAERAQNTGRLNLALAFAVSHHQLTARGGSHRTDVDFERRQTITYIQERYVIAHELFHSILEAQPEWRRQLIGDARADFLTNYLVRAVERLPDLGLTPDELEAVGESYLAQIRRFGADDALVEECGCDTLAFPLVLAALEKRIDRETIRSAVFFAQRHLRLLAILNHMVDALGREESADGWLDPFVLRTQFLQWVMSQFPQLQTMSSDPEAQARFQAEQERYSAFVEDPVLFGLQERLSRLSIDGLGDADWSNFGAVNAELDRLLGNPEGHAQAAKLAPDHFIRPIPGK